MAVAFGQPWALLGDFNITRLVEESLGGNRRTSQAIIDFNLFIDEAELDDLRFVGSFYSWSNKQGDNPILKKLDRVLVSQEWITKFPNSGANFLSSILSDHVVCFVFGNFSSSQRRFPFRFFDFWTEADDFMRIVS